MKPYSNQRSFVFGAPHCQLSKLPPIKLEVPKQLKKPKIVTKSSNFSITTTCDSSPMVKNIASLDFLPYIYAQNGIECVKTQLKLAGTPTNMHFGIEKKKSSINLIEEINETKFKYQRKVFTFDTLDDF